MDITDKEFRSNGKLLLSGEYTVMDGALSLAFPTKFGQSLKVDSIQNNQNIIKWNAFKNDNSVWIDCEIDYENWKIIKSNNIELAETIMNILKTAEELNNTFFIKKGISYKCSTFLDFPENWGLGSSSTLMNNIALWFDINPFDLLKNTFGGSGYDIACANAKTPITYQIINEKPEIQTVSLSKEITDNVLFIHLNKKQNSREGIKLYKKKGKSESLINEISEITKDISNVSNIQNLSKLIEKHEQLLSDFLEIQTVKSKLFTDYDGFIKSLGAWGGDFIMAEKKDNSLAYFREKNYLTIKSFDELII